MVDDVKSFREIFNETWLFEMPRDTGKVTHDTYSDLLATVNYYLGDGEKPAVINDVNFLTIDENEIYSWFGDFEIIVSLSKFNKGLAVQLVGNKPNASIYASDFYKKILNANVGLLLFSGSLLSSQGLRIWERLLNAGQTLMVYDPYNINNYQKISTVEELKTFYGQTKDYEKYRYVLSEKANTAFANFELMRTYRLTFNLN